MFKNVGTKLIASVIAFVNTILFTRILGVESNGLFTLLAAQVTLLTTLSNLGTDTALNYYIASNKINIKSALFNWLIFAAVQLVIILILSKYTTLFDLEELANHKMLFVTYCGISLLHVSLTGMLSGLQQYGFVNAANLLLQIALLLLWIYFSTYQAIAPNKAIYLFIVLQAIPSLIIIFYLIIKHLPTSTFLFVNWEFAKALLIYSALVVLINFIQQLALQINLLQLKKYAANPLIQAGLLGNAQKLIQLLWIVPMAISGISFSIIAKQGMDAFHLHREKNRIVFQLLCLLSLGLFLLSPYFIPLLFGSEFSNSINLFRIILIGATLFLIPVIVAPFFSGNNLLQYNLYASALCLLVAAIFGMVLIPKYQAQGAAIALSLGLGSAGLLNMFHFTRLAKVDWFYFFKPQLLAPKQIEQLLRD